MKDFWFYFFHYFTFQTLIKKFQSYWKSEIMKDFWFWFEKNGKKTLKKWRKKHGGIKRSDFLGLAHS